MGSNSEKTNNPINFYIDNCIKQYRFLCPDRLPLFINPLNESNKPKLVCTSIKPTVLRNKILLDYEELAGFVADFIEYKKLESFYKLPSVLNSPKELLSTRIGNCFEMSTLVASLLIGIGYDAFVISGYASRETCEVNLSYTMYPKMNSFREETDIDLDNLISDSEAKTLIEDNKYQMPFISKNIIQNKPKVVESKVGDDDECIANEPPFDQHKGLRIHSWVLCRQGKQLVKESFFIEPSTGEQKTLTDKNYHGIESIWNNKNYWINFQGCQSGSCSDLKFDLENTNHWEKVFFQENAQQNSRRLSVSENDENKSTTMNNAEEMLNSIWLPQSWVGDFNLSKVAFAEKYPLSQKTLFYYKTIVKAYAPFSHKTGCVLKVSKYQDFEMKTLLKTYYKYESRADRLYERIFDHRKSLKTDFYDFGRKYGLCAHQYISKNKNKLNASSHLMIHNPQLRTDRLRKRIQNVQKIEETYSNRFDFLIYRLIKFQKAEHTSFTYSSTTSLDANAASQNELVLSKLSSTESILNSFVKKYKKPTKKRFRKEQTKREIELIVERYSRNPSKAYDDDYEEIEFNLKASTIRVQFHRDPNLITSTHHLFVKPVKFEDIESGFEKLEWKASTHKSYYADPYKSTQRNEFKLYNLLFLLMKKELATVDHVRRAELEIKDTLQMLANEYATNELKSGVFDSNTESMSTKDTTIEGKNYLNAYTCDANKLNTDEVKKKYLSDISSIFTKRMNMLQKKYDQERRSLNEQLSYYEVNRYSLTDEDKASLKAKINTSRFNVDLLKSHVNHVKLQSEDVCREILNRN